MENYIGTYKVYKVFKKSQRRQILESGLTRSQAIRLVNSYPDKNSSMVVFEKQFTSSKYYI